MSNDNEHIINDDLLTRYLLGEAAPEENVLIEGWLADDPENKDTLRRRKTVIDMVALSKMDVDAEWNAFKSKLKPQTKEISFHQATQRSSMRILAIAASIAVLIGISVYFVFFFKQGPEKLMAQSKDTIKNIALADGSQVSLNRNSTLEYPEEFEKGSRTVKLNGEAFFDITPNKDKPFVVETPAFSVTVLGTSFFVSCTEGRPEKVVVLTGTVKCVHKTSGEEVVLNAGQMYTFGSVAKSPEPVTEKEMNAYAWKTARLVFVNEKFNDIISTINSTYGCHITAKGQMNECVLTVNFEDLTLDGVLNVLEVILDADITKDKNNIEIKGNGC